MRVSTRGAIDAGAPVKLPARRKCREPRVLAPYAVVLDLFGKVCAGGIGESNYPAFAYMGS